ncbi:hypothetical protein BDV96DRAFT_220243 [Lophiotrema nucula]|uniref:Uncharacterized protein n=1 Tax=Lophiotrema nucula TaxID=690887 RepID=A0A6A5YU60_9PLEO|nr:hypothetical protein BDV96DRAFT_220243 [Lophiotrema nucula]
MALAKRSPCERFATAQYMFFSVHRPESSIVSIIAFYGHSPQWWTMARMGHRAGSVGGFAAWFDGNRLVVSTAIDLLSLAELDELPRSGSKQLRPNAGRKMLELSGERQRWMGSSSVLVDRAGRRQDVDCRFLRFYEEAVPRAGSPYLKASSWSLQQANIHHPHSLRAWAYSHRTIRTTTGLASRDAKAISPAFGSRPSLGSRLTLWRTVPRREAFVKVIAPGSYRMRSGFQ